MTTPNLQTHTSSLAALWSPLRASYPLVTYRESLPNQANPAVVAKLTGHRLPWAAALVDLAQRGRVRLEEKASRLGSISFTLHQETAENQALTPYEQMLLEAIFQQSEHVPFTAVAPRLAWKAACLDEALNAELISAGWLDQARQRQRERRLAFSVKSALVGVALLIGGLVVGADFPTPAGSGLGVALALCGILGLVLSLGALGLGNAFSAFSEQGEVAAAEWKGFALFLKQVARGQKPRPASFEAHLPLVVALGLTKDLRQSRQSLPLWFSALATLRETGDWGAKLAQAMPVTIGNTEPTEALPTENSGH